MVLLTAAILVEQHPVSLLGLTIGLDSSAGGFGCHLDLNYPLHEVQGVFKVLRIAFRRQGTTPEEIIRSLVGFAEKARREGLLAMEEEAEKDRFDLPAKGDPAGRGLDPVRN